MVLRVAGLKNKILKKMILLFLVGTKGKLSSYFASSKLRASKKNDL